MNFLLRPLPADHKKSFSGREPSMGKRKVLERALTSSRAVSRDLLHTTRSLYRRNHVNELVSTIEPFPHVAPAAKPFATDEEHPAMKVMSRDDADLTLQLKCFTPDATIFNESNEHYSDSIHRTHPLTPESVVEIQRPESPTFLPLSRPVSKSPRDSGRSKPKSTSNAPEPMGKPFHVEFRPPPRKDSLRSHVFLNLVDHPTKGGETTQSVTAYVSAEYTNGTTTPPLTLTSWLSDPDGAPDDIPAWNRPSTSQGNRNPGPTKTRPKMGTRSQTMPVFNTNEIAPKELPDEAYERVLREKLRHHAGQVKKRLGTSTLVLPPTVQGSDIEVHLAFVRAAEELLKQSPIWRADNTFQVKYLLER